MEAGDPGGDELGLGPRNSTNGFIKLVNILAGQVMLIGERPIVTHGFRYTGEATIDITNLRAGIERLIGLNNVFRLNYRATRPLGL